MFNIMKLPIAKGEREVNPLVRVKWDLYQVLNRDAYYYSIIQYKFEDDDWQGYVYTANHQWEKFRPYEMLRDPIELPGIKIAKIGAMGVYHWLYMWLDEAFMNLGQELREYL